jgi:hypothetical protein
MEKNDTKQEDVSPSDAAGGSVFEVVDVSSEETYYTIGIWPTLQGAVDALDKRGDDPPGDDFDEDSKACEVRERPVGVFGWSETGRVVAKFQWVKSYEDATFNEWRRVKTQNEQSSRTAP